MDEGLVAAIRADWRTAPITDGERAMLVYVEKLTIAPGTVVPADLDALKAAGFDDRGILQIAMISGMFAYLNRIADGVGVGKDAT
jgi:uncharacterized peroxidase-related enzyme